MISLPFTNIRKVLCIGAHADDIEIGCGGMILRLLSENSGIEVHWIVMSASADRASEARNSAARFLTSAAASQVVLHEFQDGYFPAQWAEIKREFHDLGRTIQPDLILTHRLDDRHQDHRLLSELTWNAFRNHLVLEYEIPKYEGDLGHPNLYVPLDDTTCRSKINNIVDAFESQKSKPWFTPDTFWAMLRLRGLECHSPTHFAEAFHVRKMVW